MYPGIKFIGLFQRAELAIIRSISISCCGPTPYSIFNVPENGVFKVYILVFSLEKDLIGSGSRN